MDGDYGMACDRTGLLVNSVNFADRLQTEQQEVAMAHQDPAFSGK